MAKHFFIFRLVRCFKKKGFLETIHRSFVVLLHSFLRRRLMFYVDLPNLPHRNLELPENHTVEYRKNQKDISSEEFEALAYYKGERIIKEQFKERFGRGARLWLMKLDGRAVGLVWTVNQKTVEPYYFPLTEKDVHIFDNEIFCDYRGRGINTWLINYVLFTLKEKKMIRAYIETRVDNVSEIKSLAKTYFKNHNK